MLARLLTKSLFHRVLVSVQGLGYALCEKRLSFVKNQNNILSKHCMQMTQSKWSWLTEQSFELGLFICHITPVADFHITRIAVTAAVCQSHDRYLGPQPSWVHCGTCLLQLLLLPQLISIGQWLKEDCSRRLIWSSFNWRIHWEIHNRRMTDWNVIEKYIRIVSRMLHQKHTEGNHNKWSKWIDKKTHRRHAWTIQSHLPARWHHCEPKWVCFPNSISISSIPFTDTQTMEGVMSTAKGRIYAMYAMQPNTIECLLQRAQ